MVGLLSNRRHQDAKSQANIEAQRGITEKPKTGLGAGPFGAGLFARPWTRRAKVVVGSLACLGAVTIALVIALPVVFVGERNDHGEHQWQPIRPKREFPSYHNESNQPIRVLWNFPDPGLLRHNDTWYAFGTNPVQHDPSSIHVPVATSTNFVNWALLKGYDALPTIGAWELEINHWAPDVIQRVRQLRGASRSCIPNVLFRMTGSLSSTTPARPKISVAIIALVLQSPKVPILLGPTSHRMYHWLALANTAAPSTRPHSEM